MLVNNETACINNLDTAEWSLINLEMIEMSQGTKMIVEFVEMNWVKEKIFNSISKIENTLHLNKPIISGVWMIYTCMITA